MVCKHLSELYELCEKHELRLGGSDLVRIICRQCEHEETCPSILMDEYDARIADREGPQSAQPSPQADGKAQRNS